MVQRNSRYFETAELMDEAFLDLLGEKDLELVTVKDVCSRAGVSRSTFYLHYESFAELVEESVRLVFSRFRDHFGASREQVTFERLAAAPAKDLYLVTSEYLGPYLEFVRNNRRLFSAFVKNGAGLRLDEAYAALEHHLIGPILDHFQVSECERPYLMRFYLGGLMAVLEEWIRRDCADPVEEIAGMMSRYCMRGGMQRMARNMGGRDWRTR